MGWKITFALERQGPHVTPYRLGCFQRSRLISCPNPSRPNLATRDLGAGFKITEGSLKAPSRDSAHLSARKMRSAASFPHLGGCLPQSLQCPAASSRSPQKPDLRVPGLASRALSVCPRRPSDEGKPRCSFPLPPAGHPDAPGSQTVIAVFRTRNSPVFELLPWCVAVGFGVVLGWLNTSNPPGRDGEEQTRLRAERRCRPVLLLWAPSLLYPRIGHILAILSIIHLKPLCFRLPLPAASRQGPNVSA